MISSGPKHNRRSFLKHTGLWLPVLSSVGWSFGDKTLAESVSQISATAPVLGNELHADLVIIGGGLGGCAAALAAARNGINVIMTEETDWIGGQLTQQAVPPDENPWIEDFGGTRSFLKLRSNIREYYARNYPLTAKAKANKLLNPGNGWVSRLCHEPKVALAVLYEMLAPHLASGRVRLLLKHRAVSATTHADRTESVTVLDVETGHSRIITGKYFADATELGDLLPLTGTEFVTGAESRTETGERHAADTAMPDVQQGITVPFAMDYLAGEDHTIAKPVEYDFWRAYKRPSGKPDEPLIFNFDSPEQKKIGFDPANSSTYWGYRRIIDVRNFELGTFQSDITLVNWAHNDYSLGTILDPATREQQIRRAKQQSLSLLYWLQTEAPRPDGGTGWKGLRLRPDVVGTEDGLSKFPYVRESRRIRAEFTVLEQHVSTRARMRETGLGHEEVTAAPFKDSVGIGCYAIDVHASAGSGRGMFLSTVPFQIPLGALIPKRMENLLPACKNLGVTHLTNGCYRLHPVEWNIGESVGELAAFCIHQNCVPREVWKKASLLADFQKQISGNGIPLAWPKGKTKPV